MAGSPPRLMGVKCLACGDTVPVVILPGGVLEGHGCCLQGYRFCDACTDGYTIEELTEMVEEVFVPITKQDIIDHRKVMAMIKRRKK